MDMGCLKMGEVLIYEYGSETSYENPKASLYEPLGKIIYHLPKTYSYSLYNNLLLSVYQKPIEKPIQESHIGLVFHLVMPATYNSSYSSIVILL